MLLSGSKTVASYDPHTGKQIWVIDGPTEQFVASMVYNGQLLFMTAAPGSPHIGDSPRRPRQYYRHAHAGARPEHVVCPVADRRRRLLSGRGRQRHRKLLRGRHRATTLERPIGRRYSASLVTAGGLVYFTSDDGLTTVVRPGEKSTSCRLQRSRRTVLRLDGSRSWPDSAPRREASVLHRRPQRRKPPAREIGVSLSHSVCHAFTPQADWHAAFLGRPGMLISPAAKKHGTWPQWPNRGRSPLP